MAHLLKSAGGHLMSRSGHLFSDANGTDCCCGGSPCGNCDDATPKHYTCTIAGVTLFSGTCVDCSTWGFDVQITGALVANGTYILTQELGDPCSWSCTISGAAQELAPGDGACDGSPVGVDTASFTIRLTKTDAGDWTFVISGTTAPSFEIFEATGIGTHCSTEVPVFTNVFTDYACPAGGDKVQLGIGGTATLTPS